jgi:hypothetical protein
VKIPPVLPESLCPITDKDKVPLPIDKLVSTDNGEFGASRTSDPAGHKGFDVSMPKGTPLLFGEKEGKIIFAGQYNKSLGKTVVVSLGQDENGKEWTLWYGHLDKINVKADEAVGIGTELGLSGDSGNAKGEPEHCHIVLRRTAAGESLLDISKGQAVDPTQAKPGWRNTAASLENGNPTGIQNNRSEAGFPPVMPGNLVPPVPGAGAIDSTKDEPIQLADASTSDLYQAEMADYYSGVASPSFSSDIATDAVRDYSPAPVHDENQAATVRMAKKPTTVATGNTEPPSEEEQGEENNPPADFSEEHHLPKGLKPVSKFYIPKDKRKTAIIQQPDEPDSDSDLPPLQLNLEVPIPPSDATTVAPRTEELSPSPESLEQDRDEGSSQSRPNNKNVFSKVGQVIEGAGKVLTNVLVNTAQGQELNFSIPQDAGLAGPPVNNSPVLEQGSGGSDSSGRAVSQAPASSSAATGIGQRNWQTLKEAFANSLSNPQHPALRDGSIESTEPLYNPTQAMKAHEYAYNDFLHSAGPYISGEREMTEGAARQITQKWGGVERAEEAMQREINNYINNPQAQQGWVNVLSFFRDRPFAQMWPKQDGTMHVMNPEDPLLQLAAWKFEGAFEERVRRGYGPRRRDEYRPLSVYWENKDTEGGFGGEAATHLNPRQEEFMGLFGIRFGGVRVNTFGGKKRQDSSQQMQMRGCEDLWSTLDFELNNQANADRFYAVDREAATTNYNNAPAEVAAAIYGAKKEIAEHSSVVDTYRDYIELVMPWIEANGLVTHDKEWYAYSPADPYIHAGVILDGSDHTKYYEDGYLAGDAKTSKFFRSGLGGKLHDAVVWGNWPYRRRDSQNSADNGNQGEIRLAQEQSVGLGSSGKNSPPDANYIPPQDSQPELPSRQTPAEPLNNINNNNHYLDDRVQNTGF